jgi:glycosyltransferase involved in cell wall biosynthesis
MKITLLHYSAPPVVGGVESVMGHHARLMAEAGHEVQIVAGHGNQTDESVRFVHLPLADSRHPMVSSIKEHLDRGGIPSEFYELVDTLAEELWDIVSGADFLIAHNVCSLSKNLILTAALRKISERSKHLQLMLWHHDLAWTTPRYRDELHDGYPWDLIRTAWEGVEQVTISEFRRRELAALMGLPEDGIYVIPNGVDVPRFLKLEAATSGFVDQLDLLNARPIILLPVRITPRKNIELALQVLASIRQEFSEAKLIITGPLGPHNSANAEYFGKLLALRKSLFLDDAACFLAELTSEFLPDEIISDFYHLADILFLPSREEGFGIPVLEAGLAGLPAFCADIPPLRDLGMPFVNFFSLDEGPAEIAGHIVKNLLSNPLFEFRSQVRSKYAWRNIYERQIEPLLRKGEK